MQHDKGRRSFFKRSLAIAAAMLAGCGKETYRSELIGAASATLTTRTSSSSPAAWVPAVPPLIVGSAATFDLNSTLPPGVPRGGTFGIDSGGTPLPMGMSLNPNGTLAVGTATMGAVSGILFTYEEP